ncbi:hypothetical protein CJ030_MR1G015651 [Morella rubra]|uniref:Uncharacterized protein n=1 Tax=Morella rubra TaxID=262757 RepID=A0A6A1WJF6_9ROSI|nr:hypothetical protein CJ030_MR1G015651 [Morella rubra]
MTKTWFGNHMLPVVVIYGHPNLIFFDFLNHLNKNVIFSMGNLLNKRTVSKVDGDSMLQPEPPASEKHPQGSSSEEQMRVPSKAGVISEIRLTSFKVRTIDFDRDTNFRKGAQDRKTKVGCKCFQIRFWKSS